MPNSNDSPQNVLPAEFTHDQNHASNYSNLDPDLINLLFEDEPPVNTLPEVAIPTVGVKRSRPHSMVVTGVKQHQYYFKEHRQNKSSFTFEENLRYYKINPELYKQFSSVFHTFTESQIQRITWQLNSEKTILCLMQNYDFLTGLFQPEQITCMAEHSLGYENIDCLIENNILLLMLKFDLTKDLLVKLMSFKFGFKNLMALQEHSEQLKRINFTNPVLVSIASHTTGEKKLAILARYAAQLLAPPIEFSLKQLIEFVLPNGGDTLIELMGKYPLLAKAHLSELEKTRKNQRRNLLEKYIASDPSIQIQEPIPPVWIPVKPPPGKVMLSRLTRFWDSNDCQAEAYNPTRQVQP